MKKTFEEYCLDCLNNGQPLVCLGCQTGVALALLKGKKPPHYISKKILNYKRTQKKEGR
jgi:hypothetical protein